MDQESVNFTLVNIYQMVGSLWPHATDDLCSACRNHTPPARDFIATFLINKMHFDWIRVVDLSLDKQQYRSFAQGMVLFFINTPVLNRQNTELNKFAYSYLKNSLWIRIRIEDFSLLRNDFASSDEPFPTFRTNMAPSSSGVKRSCSWASCPGSSGCYRTYSSGSLSYDSSTASSKSSPPHSAV